MSIGSLIIGGGTLVLAAEIATWCFRSAAQGERQYRRAFVRNERAYRHEVAQRERAERRQIERETRRRLAQEAYDQRGAWLDMLTECMGTVWEMRKQTRSLRSQFQKIVRTNETLIRSSPLTFQQQEAIRDCIRKLETGIAKLQAYSGPYLQSFISAITNAKRAALRNSFIQPDMPDAVLPDDFPVAGDTLRLSPEEAHALLTTGRLALGCGQIGQLSQRLPSDLPAEELDAFVEDYDQDTSCWKLSLAKGVIASIYQGNDTIRSVEATLLSPSKGGFRAAWHSQFAESIDLFMPFALANPAVRSAAVEAHCRFSSIIPIIAHAESSSVSGPLPRLMTWATSSSWKPPRQAFGTRLKWRLKFLRLLFG